MRKMAEHQAVLDKWFLKQDIIDQLLESGEESDEAKYFSDRIIGSTRRTQPSDLAGGVFRSGFVNGVFTVGFHGLLLGYDFFILSKLVQHHRRIDCYDTGGAFCWHLSHCNFRPGIAG